MNQKPIGKIKVVNEMANLAFRLHQGKINPEQFAVSFPLKVDRFPREIITQTAFEAYKEQFGDEGYKEIQNDFNIAMNVIRIFVFCSLTNFDYGFGVLKNIEDGKGEKALKLLIWRAVDECIKVYPWLND